MVCTSYICDNRMILLPEQQVNLEAEGKEEDMIFEE